MSDRVRLTYSPEHDCGICGRRPADEGNVSFEGRVIALCSTCWERIKDDMKGEPDDR